MKREFVEGLGLEKDAVDKIMAENGSDLEREKAKTTAAEADLADAREKLGAAKTEPDSAAFVPEKNGGIRISNGGSTLACGYIQLKTPSTAAVHAINTEYTANEAKREKKTTNAIIMGGSFQVDRVIQDASGAVDELAFQAEQLGALNDARGAELKRRAEESKERNREWYTALKEDAAAAREQHPAMCNTGSVGGTLALMYGTGAGLGAANGGP